MRQALTLVVCLALAGCVGDITGTAQRDDAEEPFVALEESALADELHGSPVREAPVPFVRLGVMWDADRPDAIEVSTSADGESWSPWSALQIHHVEAEQTSSFVGEHTVVDGPALFYRLRATDGELPTYARVEFLQDTLSDSIEDGADADDGAIFFALGDVEVNPRSAWGAKSPRCSSNHSPYRMAIHHTDTPTNDSMSPQARLRQIQSYHQDVRGWCDIGYHFLVSRDGRLWQGRPATKLGSHAGGANTGNIGISVMGTHASTPITATQLDSIGALVAALADDYGIALNRTRIKGHREYTSTGCPGNALYGQLGAIIDRAKTGGDGSPEPPPPPPPPSGEVTVKGVLYVGANTAERIAGATITLGGRTTTTSATGYWELTGVSSGAFEVSASAPGYVSRTVARSTYAAETWASFGLSPADAPSGSATLQGVVYYGSSSLNRIPNATISLSSGHTTTADGNGYYKLTNLPAGAVTITASASGYGANSVSRTLADGETSWGSVKLD